MVPSKSVRRCALLAVLVLGGAAPLAAQSPAGFPNDPGYGFPKTPVVNPVAQGFLGKNWALDRQVKDPALRGNCGSLKIEGACETPVNLLGDVEKWGISPATNVTNVNLNVSQMTGAQLTELLKKLPDGASYSLTLEKAAQ